MSTNKEEEDAIIKRPLIIRITPEGNTELEFFSVSFSEFIIDYVYSKKDRELAASTGTRKIYCG